MIEKLKNLLSIKSIVTVVLTAVFAALALKGLLNTEQFMMIFTTVVAFYFGTQHEKKKDE